MGFSFPCPHCKMPLRADCRRAGTMTLCEHCLVSFPVPKIANPDTSPPPDLPFEHEKVVSAHHLAGDSGWHLVRLGLTVIELSMVVLLAAGLAGIAALGFDPTFKGTLFFSANPTLILALFVAVASGLTGLMGICLCCNAPGERWVRNYARVCMVLVVVAGSSGG